MILLHIFVLFGLLLPTIFPQESSSTASARLNEARALALANRARIRAHAQRIRERINHPPSPRHKRQHIVLDDSDAVVGDSIQDFTHEPHLLHVCPLGEEEEYESFPRSSKVHDFADKEDFRVGGIPRINEDTLFPREDQEDFRVGGIPRNNEDHDFESVARRDEENIHSNPSITEDSVFPRASEEGRIFRTSEDPALARSNEDIQLQPRILDILKPSVIVSPLPEASRLTVQEAQMEESLDEAIEQLVEARDKLKRVEEEDFRDADQNQIVIPVTHQSQQTNIMPQVTPTDIIRKQIIHQIRGSNPDAHIHTHLHSRNPLQGLGPFIPQTHVSVPGFHLNQHQGIAQNGHLINQDILPIIGPQILPSPGFLNHHEIHHLPSHGIFPTQNSLFHTIPQTQSTLLRSPDESSQGQSSLILNDENGKSKAIREGEDDNENFITSAEARESNPDAHINTHLHSHNRPHGRRPSRFQQTHVPNFHLNRGIAQNTPLINQGTLPITGPHISPSTGILNTHGTHHSLSQGIFPTQNSLFRTIPQTQSTNLRSADEASQDQPSLILNDENGKSKAIREGGVDDDNFATSAEAREALFGPFHLNQHQEIAQNPLHGLGPFVPHTHVTVPGFLNLNHHHGIAQNIPLINQGILPITGPQISPSTPLINQNGLPITGPQILPTTGILNTHGTQLSPSQGIFPTQNSLSHTIPQTQSTNLRSEDGTLQEQSSLILNDENGKSKAIREGENDNENFVTSPEARESVFDPYNQVDEVMDFLDKHKFRQTVPHHYSPENREADPTIHKLKQLKMLKNQKLQPNFYPAYQNPNYYGHGNLYRETDDSEEVPEEREANPTIHKLKKLKMLKEQKFQPNFYPAYQNPSYYGHGNYYRETEEIIPEEKSQEDSENQLEEERNADPTIHKLKQLKMLKEQKLQPNFYPAYQNPSYYGHGSYYRETEEIIPEEAENLLEEERDADPTIHKLKKLKMLKQQKLMPQYYQSYQKPSYYYRQAQDMDEVSSPSLFNFPSNRNRFFQYKRSLQNKTDEPNLVANISDKTITEVEEPKNRSRRSIPLMRLISDPNVRLDVPKTMENFGTVTKNAFEDERAPMYHFKHLVGSSKNALLSAMRIPPQNMIIPSDYEIVKSNDRVGSVYENEDDDPMGFSRTFKRVGHMVRESVKSGQETATHLGDIAHSARNILNSARHAAPRLIIPYSQIPAIHDPRRRTPSKAVLITPRIVDLAQERLGKKQSDQNPNLVKLGQLMEAVGISPSTSKQLDLKKIIFEPRRLHQAKTDQRLAKLYSRFRGNFDDDKDTVMNEALSALEDAKISVGARNLRDFLVKMRNELTSMVRNSPNEHKKIHKSKKKKEKEAKEMGRFIEKLFDGSEEEKNETVGAGLFLSPELMHPFMGRASQTQLKDFLGENGDEVTSGKNPSPSDHYHHEASHGDQHNNSKLGYVLGAINPLMLERMYNQTVAVDNNKVEDPESLFRGRLQEARSEESPEGKLGTAMVLNGPMLKPFMGQAQPQAVEDFLETYNGDENETINELDE